MNRGERRGREESVGGEMNAFLAFKMILFCYFAIFVFLRVACTLVTLRAFLHKHTLLCSVASESDSALLLTF